MFQATVGHSDDVDTEDAVREILDQCNEELRGRQAKGGILFTGMDFEHGLILDRIREAYPGIELIGCTTYGELSSKGGYAESSITLALIASDEIDIHVGVGRNLSKDPGASAKQAANEVLKKTGQRPALGILLQDGLTCDGAVGLQAMSQVVGDIPLFGGSAGDEKRFQNTFQFYQNEVLSDSVVWMGFSGPVQYSHGIAHGWQPIGNPAIITEAEGSVVAKIGDKRALDWFQSYVGEDPKMLLEHSLLVQEQGRTEADSYLRNAKPFADTETGCLHFLATVPKNATIQIADPISRENVLAATRKSFQQACDKFSAEKGLGLVFSCAGRKAYLGTQTKEENRILQEITRGRIPFTGFYTYGEIGPPHQASRESLFHNITIVTLFLGGS